MVSISRSLPAAAPRPEPPHYQTYLTPLLHRRFVRACILSLGVCYVIAFIIADHTSFWWPLLPFSWTGPRSLGLFLLGAMPLMVLRISQLHVSKISSPSPFYFFQTRLGSFSTYSTIFAHLTSCYVLLATYLISCSSSHQLHLVAEARTYERPRLNERFLYVTFFTFWTAFIQSCSYISRDRSRLELAEVSISPFEAVFKSALAMFKRVTVLSILAASSGIVAYLPLRSLIWEYTLAVARQVYWLNRSTTLPSFPVGPQLFATTWFLAFLMCTLSELSHLLFTVHFSINPFTADSTISDKSPDPNGTLLSGLRSAKAPLTQAMAFWELAFISKAKSDRRQSIFKDINRLPSNMWELILNECLQCISDVDIKLTEVLTPKVTAPPTRLTAPTSRPTSTAPPINIGQNSVVLKTDKATSRKFVDSIQSHDPNEHSSPVAAIRQRLPIKSIAGPENSALSSVKMWILPYLDTPWGYPFRRDIQSTASSLIPNPKLQVDSITALTKLVCSSMQEDEYGVVQRHIASILGSFNSALIALEKFIAEPPLHWTDIEGSRAGASLRLEEPELVADALRNGIREIVTTFGDYLEPLITPELRNRLLSI